MDRLSKTAKTLDKIVGFLYWVTVFGIVFGILAAVVLGFMVHMDTEFLRSNQSNLLSFGQLELLLAPGVLKEITVGNYGSYLLWTAVLSLVSAPVYCIGLLTVRDILKPFIHCQPFHETVAKDLKTLSILVAVDTALTAVTTVILDHMTRNLYDLHKLFVGEAALGERIITAGLSNATVDVTPLLFAAVLYLLSKVFLYGQELQKLSDETL